MDKNTYPVLEKINGPSDVKTLSSAELDSLASEIRAFLIENVSRTGGHLASNLGVVELSIALHRIFDSPQDHIIWDVGHQSYVHKILTGRRDRFDTLRRGGGLSGFTSRKESPHDPFGAGHSSTSISAAIGFAQADKLCGRDAYSVAVVGDGAFTGGMIHEALNNCTNDLRLIIVINENEMSISKNIGRFASNMAHIRAGGRYLRTKKATRNFIKKIPLIGNWLFRRIRDLKKSFKNMMYGSNYFEDMGLYYLGPVDGHDRAAVERLLREAKAVGQSAVIHVKTTKGKGYTPAENDPGRYHGMAPENKRTEKQGFSSVMGEKLVALAEKDSRICAITAAMADGTGLCPFAKSYPDRFFDVGIAEEHALTFAAGLAAAGMRPVVAVYSTFLQRAYDSIIHDIALQNLPVVICVDRAGLNSSDGATHHGIFDVSFLSGIPSLTVYTPVSAQGLRNSLEEAINLNAPSVIRYPNDVESESVIREFYSDGDYSIRVARADASTDENSEALIITDGRIVNEALAAKERLRREKNIACGVILLEKIKPYGECAERVASLIPNGVRAVVFLEEEIRNGGMGMLLSDELRGIGALDGKEHAIMAVDDNFATREKDEPILDLVGLSEKFIADRVAALLGK